jgi:hypothetical protein
LREVVEGAERRLELGFRGWADVDERVATTAARCGFSLFGPGRMKEITTHVLVSFHHYKTLVMFMLHVVNFWIKSCRILSLFTLFYPLCSDGRR